MKLIKLKDNHYIIVDDSKIYMGDWYYDTNDKESLIPVHQKNANPKFNNDGCKKIIYSTRPFEMSWHQKLIELSLSEVEELFDEMDLEEKSYKYAEPYRCPATNDQEYCKHDIISAYSNGYNQSVEDNKEKVIIFICKYLGIEKDSIIYNKIIKEWEQFLQPKTEWNVDFVDGKLALKK